MGIAPNSANRSAVKGDLDGGDGICIFVVLAKISVGLGLGAGGCAARLAGSGTATS